MALRDFLADIRDRYDIVMIDCPPNLHLASWASLVASDALIVPLQPEDFGAQGIADVQDSIDRVVAGPNPDLKLLGFLITMSNPPARRAQGLRAAPPLSLRRGGLHDDDSDLRRLQGIDRPAQAGRPVQTEGSRGQGDEGTRRGDLRPARRMRPTPESHGGGRLTWGKLDDLLKSGGANIAESMGAGVERATRATQTSTTPARWQGVAKSKNAIEVPLDKIVPDPDQPREEFEPESLERLAESLKTRGQLQPIRVRWDEAQGKYVLICGERRWRAARIAGMATMSCVVSEGPIDAGELLALQLVENCLREDLRPIEQARAFKTLMDRNGWSGNQAAKALGIAQPTVVRALALLELPEPVQDQVEQGTSPPATAYEIGKVHDPERSSRKSPTAWSRRASAAPRRSRPSASRRSGRPRSSGRAGGRAVPGRCRRHGRSRRPGARSPSNTEKAWTTISWPLRFARPSSRSRAGEKRPPE